MHVQSAALGPLPVPPQGITQEKENALQSRLDYEKIISRAKLVGLGGGSVVTFLLSLPAFIMGGVPGGVIGCSIFSLSLISFVTMRNVYTEDFFKEYYLPQRVRKIVSEYPKLSFKEAFDLAEKNADRVYEALKWDKKNDSISYEYIFNAIRNNTSALTDADKRISSLFTRAMSFKDKYKTTYAEADNAIRVMEKIARWHVRKYYAASDEKAWLFAEEYHRYATEHRVAQKNIAYFERQIIGQWYLRRNPEASGDDTGKFVDDAISYFIRPEEPQAGIHPEPFF